MLINKSGSESFDQILFVNWMRKTYPEHRVFHIANGGSRSKSEAARLKSEGVSAGVPDLCLPSLRMFIEMKKPDGTGIVSKEQEEWLKYLASVGYSIAVCHGCEDAKEAVKAVISIKC